MAIEITQLNVDAITEKKIAEQIGAMLQKSGLFGVVRTTRSAPSQIFEARGKRKTVVVSRPQVSLESEEDDDFDDEIFDMS